MGKVLIINSDKEVYSPEQIHETMTVKELIEQLQQYDGNMCVVLSFDNGYTYGGITEGKFHEKRIENDNN